MSMKRFDGSSWVEQSINRRHDGSNWIDLSYARRHDGSNWIDMKSTRKVIRDEYPTDTTYGISTSSVSGTGATNRMDFDIIGKPTQTQYLRFGIAKSFPANTVVELYLKMAMSDGMADFLVLTDNGTFGYFYTNWDAARSITVTNAVNFLSVRVGAWGNYRNTGYMTNLKINGESYDFALS